jgi:hypothetical protein
MNMVAQKGLTLFLLKHEKEIADAGKDNKDNEWSWLYLAFKECFGRFAGKKEFGT